MLNILLSLSCCHVSALTQQFICLNVLTKLDGFQVHDFSILISLGRF